MKLSVGAFMLTVALLLGGCGPSSQTGSVVGPAALEHGDECHLCGMLIERFAGPRGELAVQGDATPRKFCSTRDLFAFALQPENRDRIQAIYVHDMGRNDWASPSPDPTAFTDARTAWYVAGHDLDGAMGPTLASFADRPAAEGFVTKHGGRVLAYKDITLALIANLAPGGHGRQTDGQGPGMAGMRH